MTLDHMRDTFQHMAWADAQIWTIVVGTSIRDERVLGTLMHIHETQHAFLNAWVGRPMRRWKRDEFQTPRDLLNWGQAFHEEAAGYLGSLTESALDGLCIVPWARYFTRTQGGQPQDTTLRETLHQVVSHSMHHRGQVATRLRELGHAPPATDYIIWLWSGRPPTEWAVST